jgi:nicotinamide mononucleotide adenylyltransferase
MKEQYSLFIGRWQPLHEGHKYIFNERLKLGKSVCIAIRDVEPNENQPWTAEEIKQNIEKEYQNLIVEGKVKVIVIPDIESINYGRGVGYEIIEHIVPENISEISATRIREELRKEGKL